MRWATTGARLLVAQKRQASRAPAAALRPYRATAAPSPTSGLRDSMHAANGPSLWRLILKPRKNRGQGRASRVAARSLRDPGPRVLSRIHWRRSEGWLGPRVGQESVAVPCSNHPGHCRSHAVRRGKPHHVKYRAGHCGWALQARGERFETSCAHQFPQVDSLVTYIEPTASSRGASGARGRLHAAATIAR